MLVTCNQLSHLSLAWGCEEAQKDHQAPDLDPAGINMRTPVGSSCCQAGVLDWQ